MTGKPTTLHLHPVTDPEAYGVIESDALAHPGWPDRQNRYGLLLLAGGKLDQAEQAFRRSLDTNPRYSWARLNLGCTLAVQERFDEARKELQSSADPTPGARAVCEGWLAVIEERPEVGEAAVRRLPQRLQERVDVLWLRASLAMLKGNDRERSLWDQREVDPLAVACAEETSRLRNGIPWHAGIRGGLFPGLHELWHDVSRLQARREDFGSAASSQRLAYLHWSDSAMHRVCQGTHAALQGNNIAAASYYQSAMSVDPENSEAPAALAHLWAGMGKVDEAVDCIQEAVSRTPGYPDLHRQLGLMESARGNLSKARAAYERALDLNPLFAVARLELAQVLYRMEAWEAAAMAYGRVLNAGLRSADILVHLGDCLGKLGDTSQAETRYEEARTMDPQDPDIAYRQGCLFRTRGERERAKIAWRRYLELSTCNEPAPIIHRLRRPNRGNS